ncbi:uncharacterized protein LOC106363186 [Brassica napus]|uniref:uncharacterized protein LOC106363186 n=1 Tax=Brassica napus TaxID=3708 RepID=UPI0006AB0671|nr:uncharacterized protein LOC106363186 [Brassica napus]
MERWVENPPSDFLQFVPLWVQIKHIPVNYDSEKAITTLGDLVGKAIPVAFDPEKSQRQEYVRAQVKMNIANPLNKSRIINLPKECGSVEVLYFYERVQKRCYHCQSDS